MEDGLGGAQLPEQDQRRRLPEQGGGHRRGLLALPWVGSRQIGVAQRGGYHLQMVVAVAEKTHGVRRSLQIRGRHDDGLFFAVSYLVSCVVGRW